MKGFGSEADRRGINAERLNPSQNEKGQATVPADEEAGFFNLALAKWVLGILAMLIAVVGRETLLGLILHQTRLEIASLVRDEEQGVHPVGDCWFRNN